MDNTLHDFFKNTDKALMHSEYYYIRETFWNTVIKIFSGEITLEEGANLIVEDIINNIEFKEEK